MTNDSTAQDGLVGSFREFAQGVVDDRLLVAVRTRLERINEYLVSIGFAAK